MLNSLKSSVRRSQMELLLEEEDTTGKGVRSVGNALSAKSIQAFHKARGCLGCGGC